MRPMSVAFEAAVRRFDHKVKAKVEILEAGTGTILASSDLGNLPLPVADGEVVEDRTQKLRKRYTLRLADADGVLAPLTKGNGLLSNTSGNEVRLYRGFSNLPDPERYVLLGTMDIARSHGVRSATGERYVDLAGFDRSRKVSRARRRVPYNVANATPRVTAIQEMILDRLPTAEFVSIGVDAADTVPRNLYDTDDDPWEDVDRLALGGGLEVFADDEGRFVIREIPDPDADEIAWVFDTGQATLLERIEQSSDNEEAYNGWVVFGESSYGVTVLGEAYDTDPGSSTYAGNPLATPPIPPGPYGLVIAPPETVATLFTGAQATTAAEGKLRATKGAPESIDTQGGVHPGLQAGDVVQLVDAPLALDNRYVIDRVNTPLRASGRQRFKTRERRVA